MAKNTPPPNIPTKPPMCCWEPVDDYSGDAHVVPKGILRAKPNLVIHWKIPEEMRREIGKSTFSDNLAMAGIATIERGEKCQQDAQQNSSTR